MFIGEILTVEFSRYLFCTHTHLFLWLNGIQRTPQKISSINVLQLKLRLNYIITCDLKYLIEAPKANKFVFSKETQFNKEPYFIHACRHI